jgi:squalene cyclase
VSLSSSANQYGRHQNDLLIVALVLLRNSSQGTSHAREAATDNYYMFHGYRFSHRENLIRTKAFKQSSEYFPRDKPKSQLNPSRPAGRHVRSERLPAE